MSYPLVTAPQCIQYILAHDQRIVAIALSLLFSKVVHTIYGIFHKVTNTLEQPETNY
jgi:hypothetical protein